MTSEDIKHQFIINNLFTTKQAMNTIVRCAFYEANPSVGDEFSVSWSLSWAANMKQSE